MYIIFRDNFNSNGDCTSTEYITAATYNHALNVWTLDWKEEPINVKVFHDSDSFVEIAGLYPNQPIIVGKTEIGVN